MRARLVAVTVMLLSFACTKPAPESSPPIHSDATDSKARPSLTGIVDEETFKALHELTDAEAPPPRGETVRLAGSDAYLSLPENAEAPVPAVIVIHEWWGLNDHIRHWTDRLAADGYAALAVDLYHGQIATDPDGAMALMKQVDETEALAMLQAAHDFLAADPRVHADKQGVIGWCFGGGWALRDAIAHSQVDAAVIYYGHPITDPAVLASIEAPLLGIFANQDQAIPPAIVDEFAAALASAGKTIELHRYDALHAFANPSNPKYDQAAAADAWDRVRAFFATHLRE
jgi:carboxymethylenebutenolidase